jgi:NADPH2:quinone reductase
VVCFTDNAHNTGDDVAGTIAKVGKNVTEFKEGDRVAAFHEMMKDHGAFAEYAVAFAATTFHIPQTTSYEEAATLPLAALTAVYGMFDKLALPSPLRPAEDEIPLLVYGASSAVGAFAIKLAKLANIHPIIGVAGSGSDFAKQVGADFVVDRRKGKIVEDIKEILGGRKLLHAFDAISEGESAAHISAVLSQGGLATTVLPGHDKNYAEHVKVVPEMVGEAHTGTAYQQDLAYAFCRLFTRWLADGRFTAHPYEVVAGGLEGVVSGLQRLQKGEVSSKKLVFRVADTPGL